MNRSRDASNKTLSAAFVLSCAAALLGHADSVGAEPATWDIDTICHVATQWHTSIKSLKVAYEVVHEKLLDAPSVRDAVLDPERLVFSFKDERRISKYVPQNPGSPEEVASFDGVYSLVYSLGQAMLLDGKDFRCERSDLYAVECLDLPISDEDRVQYDALWFYPHCLRKCQQTNRSKYTVLPELEKIGDAWCHVLVCPKIDKIWVDHNLKCCIRQREQYWDNGKDTALLVRYSFDDITLTSDGIPVPRVCTRELFGRSADPPKYYNQVVLEDQIRVHEIEVNDVADQDFAIALPPGTIVLQVNEEPRVIPGNDTHLLNDFAALANDAMTQVLDQHNSAGGRSSAYYIFVTINIIIIFALIGFLLLRSQWRKT